MEQDKVERELAVALSNTYEVPTSVTCRGVEFTLSGLRITVAFTPHTGMRCWCICILDRQLPFVVMSATVPIDKNDLDFNVTNVIGSFLESWGVTW